MNTTLDIDTTGTAPALAITDLKHLADVIYDMAQAQLILNKEDAKMQSQVEIIKKAYNEATAEHVQKIKDSLAAVEAYATTHKDTLFPVKGGKRKKTFAILQHALKFRESSSVEAPANVVDLITQIIAALEAQSALAVFTDEQQRAEALQLGANNLKALLRQPDKELNKDAIKSLTKGQLAILKKLVGIDIVTAETFKVEFAFTPEPLAA